MTESFHKYEQDMQMLMERRLIHYAKQKVNHVYYSILPSHCFLQKTGKEVEWKNHYLVRKDILVILVTSSLEYTQNTKSCQIKMPIDPELYHDEIINSWKFQHPVIKTEVPIGLQSLYSTFTKQNWAKCCFAKNNQFLW